jgi:hypothetical protein
VPAPGEFTVTVAVNVTDWPKTDGFTLDITVVVVASTLTTCDSGGVEVLDMLFASPLYVAVIECVATLSVDVEYVATPEPFSVVVPSVVAPSLKVTFPVGVPFDPETVAVNVTDWPKTDGFALEVNVVVVAVEFTTCETVFDVLPLLSVSPT